MNMMSHSPANDKSNNACSGEDGFSLVEMLVALAILGMIGTLMSSFAVQLRQLDNRSKAMAFDNELNVVLDHVVKIVASAVSQPFQIISGQPSRVFTGRSDWVRFVANSRVSSSNRGLRDIEISATRKSDESVQLLQKNAFLSPSSEETLLAEDPVILFDDFNELNFQFANGPELEWTDRWEKSDQLPFSVKVTVSYAINGQQRTLEKSTRLLNSAD